MAVPSDPRQFPRRKAETAFRAIGEQGGLVVIPGRAEVKVLNPVAIRIFELLDGRHSVEQIAEAVCGEFEVTRDQALGDVGAFLDELSAHGMLEEVAAGEEGKA